MKVCCCTYYSPSYKALANISIPNLSEYCMKHNYAVCVQSIDDDKWEYKKHELFKDLFEEDYDLIWYRDIDSVITNMNIPITDFVDKEGDFFLTQDFNELNGGSVIIKNSHYGRMLNNSILRFGRERYENEQNYYNKEVMVMRICETKVLPHPSINSYDYSLYPECKEYVDREDLGDWKEGNFVLHVPALSMGKRIEVLKNAKIVR
jgi:hypothetical protein